MVLLNAWALFAILPLWLLYKRHIKQTNTRQIKLLYLSLLFMIIALSEPALKNAPTKQNFNSQDFIIAIDASYSMMAEDIKPNRFEAAKKAIKKLLKLHPKDRFTLFAFTSNALLISPPTTDTAIAINALDTLNPKYILTKSTSLENLFETVGKVSFKKKKLIIFSDGGDDTDIAKLVGILKKYHITPYFVATATEKGAALKKGNAYLKNDQNELVISKINPALQDIASLSGGRYYKLISPGAIDTLSDDITDMHSTKKSLLQVQSYKELFTIPLLIAIALFFVSITKLHQLLPLLLLAALPYKSQAGVLDFYYLDKATKAYNAKNYKEAASYFSKLRATPQSYYNTATAYYKAGHYKKALALYSRIKTRDPKLKAAIYYNMASAAVKIKKYDEAKRLLAFALALDPDDKDALYNLTQLQKLHLQNKRRPKLRLRGAKEQKTKSENARQHPQNKQKKGGSSNRSSTQQTSGSGGEKQNTKKQGSIRRAKNRQNNYKMGYKAYEIINKGYANEKEPW